MQLDLLTRERTGGGRLAPSVLDWLVAVALVIVSLVEGAAGVYPGPVGVATAVLVATTVPVAFRRIAPLGAIALSAAVGLPYVIAYAGRFGEGSVANAAMVLLLSYSVGRHSEGRRLLAGAAFALLLIVEPGIGTGHGNPVDWAFDLVTGGGALGLGLALRLQVERSTALAVAAERARSEQEATAHAAVQEERARIARELHDVVAHNVGLIVLQAGGARSVLAAHPDRARIALRRIEEVGRQTLAEMRHLVGILRVDQGADLHSPSRPKHPDGEAMPGSPFDGAAALPRTSVLDWLVALALVTVALVETVGGGVLGPVWVAAALQLVAILPVAFRRVAPVRAIAITAAAFLPYVALYGAGNSAANAATALLLTYSIGRQAELRRLLAGAAFAVLLLAEELAGNGRLFSPSDWAYLLVVFGGALGLGVALRLQVQRSISLAVAAERAASEQQAAARAAVHEERSRIARELHDVVGDKVGLIVLQAGGARNVLGADPERARAALVHVEEMGRDMLAEMRNLVGILRVDEGADRLPMPCLGGLPELVDEARDAGLTVDLEISGPVVGLPAGLEVAAYRLIQEALTNVRKHAPASRVVARLCYEADGLRVSVRDDGGLRAAGPNAARRAPGPGHGLIGMRERVQLYGGRLETGPIAGGGFRVEAVLPLAVGST